MTNSIANLEASELLARVLRPSDTAMVEATGDELVVVNTADEGTYYLNPTARVIWEMLDGERSGNDILAALQQAYEAGPNADHLVSTLRGFAGGGLVESV